MAEFCLDCWNKLNGTKDPKWKYIMSEEPEPCEECGQRKPVIVIARSAYYAGLLRRLLRRGGGK